MQGYFELRRTRVLLGSFAAASSLFVAFPALDLRVSAWFYDHGFYLANQAWVRLLHASVSWFVIAALVTVVLIRFYNRYTGKRLLAVDGRTVIYLLLVLAVGAGLVVNGLLKDGFGRARPREIEAFGGVESFTPAWVMSAACDRNCSFSSGDSAGAFFALACAAALGRRRAAMTVAVGYGVLVSTARIAAGAHFLSDTVVSYFIMRVAADALHHRLYAAAALRPLPAPAPAAPASP